MKHIYYRQNGRAITTRGANLVLLSFTQKSHLKLNIKD